MEKKSRSPMSEEIERDLISKIEKITKISQQMVVLIQHSTLPQREVYLKMLTFFYDLYQETSDSFNIFNNEYVIPFCQSHRN